MKWRSDFPLLTQKIKGKALVYLDTAASSLKPWPVIEKVGHFLTYQTANVHRGSTFFQIKPPKPMRILERQSLSF
jgi:cysteine desulfurase/selenocysteine lyase